jgi:dipeptidyl aminopeptidase/acylaminoacyl peptidase
LTRWTSSNSAGVNPLEFVEPKVARWKSFDGVTISGFVYQPDKTKFPGKRPVIVNIHGGPEGQARPGFINRNNYMVNEMGIAMIFPNVRGSSGFGKTFLDLDNGKRREDSVKDIGALFDWIAAQPDLDASRVMVTGGSYGGYMSLAVSVHYADKIAGSIDVVGISNFVTFLTNTESYRRDLRRVEYGDERDPDMRAFLEKISPLNNAEKIKKPMFVVQGRNDPRVPFTEAEQIVAQLKKQKTPVWFLMANDEGHGFAKKNNADFLFYSQIKFLQEMLFK